MKKLDYEKIQQIVEKHPERFLDEKILERPDDILYNLIVEEIKIRSKKGWTQKDLAEKMNTKQSAISRFENYGRIPSVEFLNRICEALETELSISLDGEYTLSIPDEYKKVIKEKASDRGISSKKFIEDLFFSNLDDYLNSDNEYESSQNTNFINSSQEDDLLCRTKENSQKQSLQNLLEKIIAA